MTDSEKDRIQTIQSFIERCNSELKKEVDKLDQKNKEGYFKHNRLRSSKENRKKYDQSEKGKEARKRVAKLRQERFLKACEGVRWEEMRLIKYFYRNCPKGYEVDHIIPISKGGTHTLSNLQYLKPRQNRRKAGRTDWEFEE
jgi:5-methylcytosine-specific restriction endonuclease McrA